MIAGTMHLPGGVPSAHVDPFMRAQLPPPELWPRFDYFALFVAMRSRLPALATYASQPSTGFIPDFLAFL